jgi:hypothetical protein
MNLSLRGGITSLCEVTNITPLGFWVYVDEAEYFVPFADYPEFEAATIAQIHAVQRVGPSQLYWPDLDIDIELDALTRSEAYPLKFNSSSPNPR